MFRVGTAGWSIPGPFKSLFKTEGSHLVRYAQAFNAVEINSSFYREHEAKTYLRWANETPAGFQMSVKLSRQFTHDERLHCKPSELKASLLPILGLKRKLGVILIQLPPSLEFENKTVKKFMTDLRKIHTGKVAIEPRHESWASPPALKVYESFSISKIIADPERCRFQDDELERRAQEAGGFIYLRLHGSPVIYKSRYENEFLEKVSERMKSFSRSKKDAWCIFDNTTYGFSVQNAFQLNEFN